MIGSVSISVVGEGITGGVSLEPNTLDFGTVIVGGKNKLVFSLLNANDCEIPYYMIIATKDENQQYRLDTLSKLTYPKDSNGVLSARSHKVFTLYYCPTQRMMDKFTIFCALPLAGQSTIKCTNAEDFLNVYTSEELENMPKCEIVGKGSFPSLGVTDVKSETEPKANLWQQCSVNAMNNVLAAELDDMIVTKNESISFGDIIKGLKRVLFDFGCKPEVYVIYLFIFL